MDLQLKVELVGKQQVVITLAGILNAINAMTLKNQIKTLVAEGRKHVIIEMSGVSFIDSSGLAALVSGLKTVRSVDGSLKLAAVSEQPRDVFKLTMLERVFSFYPTPQAALDAKES